MAVVCSWGASWKIPINNRFSKSRPTLITHHTADDELSNGTVQKLLEALNIKTQTLRAFLWDGYFEHQLKIYHQHPIIWPLRMGNTKTTIWIDSLRANANDITDAIQRSRQWTTSAQEDLGLSQLQSLISKGPSHIGERPVEQSASYAVHSADGLLCQSARLWPAIPKKWLKAQKRWKAMASRDDRLSFAWSRSFQDFWPSRFQGTASQGSLLGTGSPIVIAAITITAGG